MEGVVAGAVGSFCDRVRVRVRVMVKVWVRVRVRVRVSVTSVTLNIFDRTKTLRGLRGGQR